VHLGESVTELSGEAPVTRPQRHPITLRESDIVRVMQARIAVQLKRKAKAMIKL
jgi:hypothetical protein